jgi:3-methylfumaryl-CoA hydratase
MPEETRLDPATLDRLQTWVGKTEPADDAISAAPVRALAATLDRDDPLPQPGMPLPPLWHWLYFLPTHRASEIGEDGHARRGGFLPPVPLPRRMWAGGRLLWELANPLRVGDAARRVSRIASVQHKSGRSGDLVFVTVVHELHNAQGLALTEEHDIVYRGAPQPGEAAPLPTPAPGEAAWQRTLTPDEVLLFRYSALTFNGHRIHYDRRYVTQVEGYPGLVVHGPLIATLLLDLLRRHTGRTVRRFEFKAVRPTFDGQPMRASGQPAADGKAVALWAQDHEGWLTMQASAEIEP